MKISVIVVPQTDEFMKDISHHLEIYINKNLGVPKLKERNAKYAVPYSLSGYKADTVYHIVNSYEIPECTILELGNPFILKSPWNAMGNYRRFEYHSLESFSLVEVEDGVLDYIYLVELSPSVYLEPKTKKNLSYALKQVQIRNYQCIKSISIESIPVDAQWLFITGKNGTGKSSLLQAIVMGLIGGNLSDDLKQDMNVGVELLQNSEGRIHLIGTEKLPILAYGASRLRIQSEQVLEKDFGQDNTYSLFNPTTGNLMNIEPWIKDAKLNGEESKIEMVQDVLCQLMPSVTKITLKGSHITYIENGLETSLEKLASGNRSILAMVGDILIRLFYFFPDAKKPSDLQGIVLIDEIDLHLHPYWQRELPWRLSEIFPNIQFICTTHSIIPFMGAPKRSVFFTMDRTDAEGSTIERLDLDVSNFSADILLTSPLFDVSLFSKVAESEGNTQGYRTEDDYKDYEESIRQSEEFKELQKKYGDIFGEKVFKK